MTDTMPTDTTPAVASTEPEQMASAALEHLTAEPAEVIPAWRELQGLAAMAVTLSAANIVPAALRGRPNDVFLILLTARELGIAPTAALRTCYVVNGAVTLAPKLRAAMVRQKGIGRLWPDPANNREKATWHATRADEDHAVTYTGTWTIEEARQVQEKVSGKLASLTDKDNWQNYPQRMLSWRCLGWLLDDVFPDVGAGIFSPDELGAVTDDEGNSVINVDTTDPLPGTAGPRGHHGSTPPPPNPNDDPLPEAVRDALATRIATLAEVPGAKAALVEMWTTPREGVEPMPQLANLAVRHGKRAEAMIASVEKRVAKGEWKVDAEVPPCEQDAEIGPQDDPGAPFEAEPAPTPPAAEKAARGPLVETTPDNPCCFCQQHPCECMEGAEIQ